MTTDYQDLTTIDTPQEERRKLYIGDIWSNAAQCLECNEIIRSKNRHHHVTCKCDNISVDGGSWYARRGFKTENYKNIIVPYNNIEEEE